MRHDTALKPCSKCGAAQPQTTCKLRLMDRSPNVAERALFGERYQFVQLPINTWMARATLAGFCLVSLALGPFSMSCYIGSCIRRPIPHVIRTPTLTNRMISVTNAFMSGVTPILRLRNSDVRTCSFCSSSPYWRVENSPQTVASHCRNRR